MMNSNDGENRTYVSSGSQQINVALYALLGDFPSEKLSEAEKLEILLG